MIQLWMLLADAETQEPLINWPMLTRQIVTTIFFIILGLIFFCISDWLVERIMPKALRKGIEEDRNIALAIVIGASILGIAWIVAAAIHG
ncbi:MAG TPA: DUF350 domain-containing protein [Gemmataceae bacterium]|nr:DUF350 domain-containing protein [Gemmataceae bacterium]